MQKEFSLCHKLWFSNLDSNVVNLSNYNFKSNQIKSSQIIYYTKIKIFTI